MLIDCVCQRGVMLEPRALAERIVAWLSPNGRIDRRRFFLHYLVPAALSAGLAAASAVPDLFLIPLGILFVGMRKRLNDTGVKVSRGKKHVLGGLGIVAIVIAAAVAFVLFLGGISGMGNEGLLLMAAVVIAAPFVLPVAGTVVFALFAEGSPDENEHGPAPGS
jgi:uncharacterized membrane protein YhaH (DUF805 family)